MFQETGELTVALEKTERRHVKPASTPEPGAGLPEAVRSRIGVKKRRRCLVTARDIRRFAQAIGETVAAHGDDDDETLLAPPLFCQTLSYDELPVELLPPDGSPAELDVPVPAKRLVGGASDFTLHRRVRAGELLTVETQLKDLQVKQGKSGVLYLLFVETHISDAEGKPVSTDVATYVKRP